MTNYAQPNNTIQKTSLHKMVFELSKEFGREELGKIIDINCFKYNPTLNSSLIFLRKTPRAREQVEQLYMEWKSGQITA